MDYKLLLIVLFSLAVAGSGENLESGENATTSVLKIAETLVAPGRTQRNLVYANLISCAMRYDATCLLDAAGDYLEKRKNELLAQADIAALKATGRADPETTPSHVAHSIETLLTELSGLFRDHVLSFFNGKEAGEDDEVVNSEDGSSNSMSRNSNGAEQKQMRKKKEGLIQKLIKFIHKVFVLVVIAAKVHFLLRFLGLGLKFLYWLVTVGHLILRAIELWLRKKTHHEPEIHYEISHHSEHHPEEYHHDHHEYEHDDYPGHEYSRSYLVENHAQNLAYAKQKPEDSSLFSWVG